MNIDFTREKDVLIANVSGRIDGANALEFEGSLNEAVQDGDRLYILNFKELSYISSAGLRVILLTARTLQKQEVRLALCELSEAINEVFQVSGFDQIIPIHATLAEARAK